MAQYIDKAAVETELQRRLKSYKEEIEKYSPFQHNLVIDIIGKKEECNDILSFLNTLEVKEVGLKKDFELTWEDVAWIVNETILKCKVESALTAEDICKDVLKLFKAHKGDIV